MLPYSTFLSIDRTAETPLFQQIANALILHIKKGIVPANTRLPGTRLLAEMLGVHRKTILAACQELAAQGWIVQVPSKGTFVSSQLPEIKPQPLDKKGFSYPSHTGYALPKHPAIAHPVLAHRKLPGFDDGFPDSRLAPLEVLGRKYRSILSRSFQQHLLGYADTAGNPFLRQKLAQYLHQTRGLPVTAEHVFITRGSVMGIDLVARLLLKKGDKVVVGETSYFTANMIFQQAGATLLKIKVDEAGLCVHEIEGICEQHEVRLLYLTPHHHYPTTVPLSAERRIRLLQLAERYGFAIIEDDYDYDFHYAGRPVLPLASADTQGMVAYVGSFAKTIAPAIRVGYVVAPANLIEQLGYLRRITDRQGDNVLEQALAEMLAEGEIQRSLKKAQKVYHQRRDFFCNLLEEQFSEVLDFERPEGGMAVWARFRAGVQLPQLAEKARKNGVWLNDGSIYNPSSGTLNATRMGFASLTTEEAADALSLLKKLR